MNGGMEFCARESDVHARSGVFPVYGRPHNPRFLSIACSSLFLFPGLSMLNYPPVHGSRNFRLGRGGEQYGGGGKGGRGRFCGGGYA